MLLLETPSVSLDQTGCTPDLLEVHNAVSAEVRGFATRLVERRCLAESMVVQPIPVQEMAEVIRIGFMRLSQIAGYDHFVQWTAQWAQRFAQRAGAQAVSVRLAHSRRPMCPRFHTDNVTLRFIGTLLGPGSEWLAAQDVRYSEQGEICPESLANVQRMSDASVGFFKGAKGSETLPAGVVHRSPDVRADRVLLTMDLVPV